jgi:hypothetical protein
MDSEARFLGASRCGYGNNASLILYEIEKEQLLPWAKEEEEERPG